MALSTRDIILDTASKLFYNKGYNLVGINEVIQESGIAKATLYAHFKSKDDLCKAYLDKMDNQLLTDLDAYVKTKPIGDKRVLAVFEFLREFYDDKSFNGCWCIRTIAEVSQENRKIRDTIKTNKSQFLDYIISLVNENKAELTPKKRSILAKRVYLLYEAAVSESNLHKESWPIDDSYSLVKALLKMG